MRVLMIGCVLVFAPFTVARADEKEEKANKTLENLQGTWRFVSIERDGKVTEFKNELPGFNLVVTGTRFAHSDGKHAGELTLNPFATPPAIDLGYRKPDEVTAVGIYKLDGDTLALCLKRGKGEAKDRPAEFATKGTPEVEIRNYVRVKPKK